MSFDRGPATTRPPVALGCFLAAAVAVAIAGVLTFVVVFLDSGANTGRLTLEPAEAYEVGYVEYLSDDNIFLVRLRNGEFVALADMDAANRNAQSRRCRVALVAINEAATAISAEALRSRLSAGAEGSTSVFREACFGAVYDLAGTRLDADGRNLDRHPVGVNSAGRVIVDTSKRECSERTGTVSSVAVSCSP